MSETKKTLVLLFVNRVNFLYGVTHSKNAIDIINVLHYFIKLFILRIIDDFKFLALFKPEANLFRVDSSVFRYLIFCKNL